jgi:hypothetical protein
VHEKTVERMNYLAARLKSNSVTGGEVVGPGAEAEIQQTPIQKGKRQKESGSLTQIPVPSRWMTNIQLFHDAEQRDDSPDEILLIFSFILNQGNMMTRDGRPVGSSITSMAISTKAS